VGGDQVTLLWWVGIRLHCFGGWGSGYISYRIELTKGFLSSVGFPSKTARGEKIHSSVFAGTFSQGRVEGYSLLRCFFFAETFRSFFAETFWSLKDFGHLSHSCIKTRCSSNHLPMFSDILSEMTIIFGHFKIISVYDRKKKNASKYRNTSQFPATSDSSVSGGVYNHITWSLVDL